MSHGNQSASEAAPACKGCSASVHVTPEEMEQLFDRSLRVTKVKAATEEEYARRMAICRQCDAFQFGTTCRWCGCLMAVKAKLAAARCPDPAGSRWESATRAPFPGGGEDRSREG